MNALEKIDRKIARANAQRSKLHDQKREVIRATLITCEKCKLARSLSSWVFVQKFFWVAPYSCTGGAYWSSYEVGICDILCPECQHVSYLHLHPQRDEIVALVGGHSFRREDLFREVREKYDEQYS